MNAIMNGFKGKRLIAAVAVLALALCVCVVAMPADAQDGDATETPATYEAQIGETQYETLEAAYAAATNGQKITLLTTVALDATLNIEKSIIIDGDGNTVTGPASNKIVNIMADNVTIENVVFDNNNSSTGIQAYCAQNVTLTNVSSISSTNAGLIVNGSTVTIDGTTMNGNVWGDINVANGVGVTDTLRLTVAGTNNLTSGFQIWSEMGSDYVVFTGTENYTEYGWKKANAVSWGAMWLENGTMTATLAGSFSDSITIPAGSQLRLGTGVTAPTGGTIVVGEGASFVDSAGTAVTGTNVDAVENGEIAATTVEDIVNYSMTGADVTVNTNISVTTEIEITNGTNIVIGDSNRITLSGNGTITVTDGASVSGRVVGSGTNDGTAVFSNLSGNFTVKAGSIWIDASGDGQEISSGEVRIAGNVKITGELTGNVTLILGSTSTIEIPAGEALTIAENGSLDIQTNYNGSNYAASGSVNGTLNIYGSMSYDGVTPMELTGCTPSGNNNGIKVYSGASVSNINMTNVSYGTTDDGQFQFGDTLNSNYTVTANEYLSRDLTIPAGVTLTIAANGNLNLAGNNIYIYGTLEIQAGGSVSGLGSSTGSDVLYLMRNGTITNAGTLGYGMPVTVSADTAAITNANTGVQLNYEASGSVQMQNITGISFGLANTGETNKSNQPIYMMTVTGNVQSYGMASSYTADFSGVRIIGDLYVGQGITVNFVDKASTLMSSATLTVDGTVNAGNQMLVMANNSTIVVNGNIEGTIAAQTGNYKAGSSYADSGLTSVTTFNASSKGTNYITGYTLTVGTYEYQEGTGSNTQAMIAQRLYAEGTVSYGSTSSTPDTNPDVDISISGSIIVAEGSVLSLPANMNITNGTVIVQGEVNFAYASANTNATSPIASYEGAFYTVTVTSPARSTTGYIVPFETAMGAIETADNNKVTVMGDIEIVNDLTIATGQNVDITNATVEIDENAEVILQTRATLSGPIADVNGVFTAYNGSTYATPAEYDTYAKGTDYVRYSGIVAALDNAVAGDVIDVTRPVTGVEDLTIPQGVTVNASANITIDGDLVVETEATLKMTNSSTLLLNGEKSTATVNGTLNLEEGTISFTHKTDDNSLASAGTTVMTGTNFTNISGIVDGVVYTNEDSMRVITNAAAALVAAAAQDVNKSVSFYGTTSSGDLTATVDIIVDADADATVSSIALADGETITLNGKLTGAVTVQTGVAGSESASTVDLNKASGIVIIAGSVTDNQGVRTYELQLANAASAAMAGKVTVSAGTANIATSGALTVDGDGVVLTVASGATLIVGEGETLNVGDAKSTTNANATSVDAVVVEGTLVADKGTVNIGYSNGTLYNGFMLVSGTFQVADETDTVDVAAGSTLTVTGTLDISTTADKEAVVAIDGILVVGEKPNTVGASGAGVVSGAVSVANTDAAYIKAYNGSDLSAALINIGANGETTIDSTAFYINSELYMTVYAEGNVDIEKTILENEKFSLVGYLTKYSSNPVIDIATLESWFSDADMSVNIDDSSMIIGGLDAIYFKAQTATVDVVVSVGTGISLYIDNIKMTSGVPVELAVGTHTVSATVDPGFTGTTQVMFNGNVVSGSFEITADMASGAYEGTVSVTATGDIQQQTTVIDGGNGGSNDMGLTDYLLIILVILIVVMAIIVALRLMRS